MRRPVKRALKRKRRQSGVTLMELLIAVTLVAMLSAGILLALRVGLNALDKTDKKLMSNRRVASVERILEQQAAGLMPVTADCQTQPDSPPARIGFFQGEAQSMRFASAYSLSQGARGLPMLLEYQVIPGDKGQGVRLVVNERVYTGASAAGAFCLGFAPDETGRPAPRFVPIQVGPGSFVLADKLAYCRFSFREELPPPAPPRWLARWVKPALPSALRLEMAPLQPDSSRLQVVTLTIPVRVTRIPGDAYAQ